MAKLSAWLKEHQQKYPHQDFLLRPAVRDRIAAVYAAVEAFQAAEQALREAEQTRAATKWHHDKSSEYRAAKARLLEVNLG